MRYLVGLSVLLLVTALGLTHPAAAQATDLATPNQSGAGPAGPVLLPVGTQATPTPQLAWPVTPVPLKVSTVKATPTASCPNPYVVRRGDTLSAIALRCRVTVANLRQWNNLRSDVIWIGQRLITRSPTARVPAPTPTPWRARTGIPTPTPWPADVLASPASSPIIALPTPTPVPVIVEPTALPPAPTAAPAPVSPPEPTPTPRLVPTVGP